MFECDVLLVGGGIMVLFGVFDWNGLDVILFFLVGNVLYLDILIFVSCCICIDNTGLCSI